MRIKRTLSGIFGVLLLLPAISANATVAATDAFTDVSPTNPNYEAINNLKFNGVISGYPDGTFKPDQPVNRVEVLKMIFEGLDITEPTTLITPSFADIDLNSWYGQYLKKAATLQMIEGYADGTFKPAQTVNLVENLKLILEASKVELPTTISQDTFNDTPKDQWYAKYVQYAKDTNIIEADSSGNVYPAKGMTRGDFAETLFRLRTVVQQGKDTFTETPATEDTIMTLNIQIQNNKFSTTTLTVSKGTTVKWTNMDSAVHTVTADDASWGSNNLNQTDLYIKTFDQLGTFTYHCENHPTMKGTIIVKNVNEVPTI